MRVTEEGCVVSENGGDEVNAITPVFVAVSPRAGGMKCSESCGKTYSPQYPIESRRNDALGRNGSWHTLAWYSFMKSVIRCTMICQMEVNNKPETKRRKNRMSHIRYEMMGNGLNNGGV
jgi:hypothetical protein